MAIAMKEFSVPLALLLIGVMVYLLIIGKLSGLSFAGSLIGVAALIAVVAVVLPRSEEVSEVGAKVGGQELLVRLEKVRDEIYAKASELQRLSEGVGELAAFELTHLFRYGPDDPESILIEERNRLATLLKEMGINRSKIDGIVSKVTAMVTRDYALKVYREVSKEITGPGKPHRKTQELDAIGTDLVDRLLKSPPGKAEETTSKYLSSIGALTESVKRAITTFDTFRVSDSLPI